MGGWLPEGGRRDKRGGTFNSTPSLQGGEEGLQTELLVAEDLISYAYIMKLP